MIAAIATIAFLSIIWLVIVSIAGSLEANLVKVSAALRGQSSMPVPVPVALRISQRYPQARNQRASAHPALRAAA